MQSSVTHQNQDFGSPMMSTASNRKFASHTANPTRRVEKEFLSDFLSRTRMANMVPIRPKMDTTLSRMPSTMYSNVRLEDMVDCILEEKWCFSFYSKMVTGSQHYLFVPRILHLLSIFSTGQIKGAKNSLWSVSLTSNLCMTWLTFTVNWSRNPKLLWERNVPSALAGIQAIKLLKLLITTSPESWERDLNRLWGNIFLTFIHPFLILHFLAKPQVS